MFYTARCATRASVTTDLCLSLMKGHKKHGIWSVQEREVAIYRYACGNRDIDGKLEQQNVIITPRALKLSNYINYNFTGRPVQTRGEGKKKKKRKRKDLH